MFQTKSEKREKRGKTEKEDKKKKFFSDTKFSFAESKMFLMCSRVWYENMVRKIKKKERKNSVKTKF